MKICCRCRLERPLDSFGKSSREADGLRPECKTCRAADYASNAHRLRAKQGAYYRANREQRRRAQRVYNLINAAAIAAKSSRRRSQWTQSQRLQAKALKDSWKLRNPEKVAASSAVTRHNRLAAPGEFTSRQWLLLCSLYRSRCAACGSCAPLTPDHIVALARGGSNDIANIQPLCLGCNRRKWVRPIVYGFQPYVNPARMLANPDAWLAGEPTADALLPIVYQNGAVQPLLFEADT